MRRERAVKDKARKTVAMFVLHVTEWALRERRAARQGKEFRATCSPLAGQPTQHASLCLAAQACGWWSGSCGSVRLRPITCR